MTWRSNFGRILLRTSDVAQRQRLATVRSPATMQPWPAVRSWMLCWRHLQIKPWILRCASQSTCHGPRPSGSACTAGPMSESTDHGVGEGTGSWVHCRHPAASRRLHSSCGLDCLPTHDLGCHEGKADIPGKTLGRNLWQWTSVVI